VVDFSKMLPGSIRKDVKHGETNFPEVPDDVPKVVAADPSWCRRWLAAPDRPRQSTTIAVDDWDADRKQQFRRVLAAVGWGELSHIVPGCSYVATHHEMPGAWRAYLVKQAYEDMQHAASFISRACRYSDENYRNDVDSKATFVHPDEKRVLNVTSAAFSRWSACVRKVIRLRMAELTACCWASIRC
jgi:hypothetical protein